MLAITYRSPSFEVGKQTKEFENSKNPHFADALLRINKEYSRF
jgi:hypothetical protein